MEDLPLVQIDVPLRPQAVEELLVVLGIKQDDAFAFGNGLGHYAPLFKEFHLRLLFLLGCFFDYLFVNQFRNVYFAFLFPVFFP